MDEDLLQHRIYFLAFLESLEMIFLQYTETCEVLLDYPKTGWVNIKGFSKNSIRNLLHTNIHVYSRRLITEFPADGIKCIEIFQSYCANMVFADKSKYDRSFQQVPHIVGEYAINFIKIFQN